MRDYLRKGVLLLFWLFGVCFWWVLLPFGNLVCFVTGLPYELSFDEYFEWLAEEFVCIVERGVVC